MTVIAFKDFHAYILRSPEFDNILNMIPYLEINTLCISCDNCKLICPENAVLKSGNEYIIETWSCTLCNACIEVCPVDCIKLVTAETKKKIF